VHPCTTTYPIAPDHTSLPRWAPALPYVPRPRTSPLYQGGLWHCHVSRSPRPHPQTEVGSCATTCPAAPDLSPLPRWALALPRVREPWTSPPCRGGLRRFHVSHSSGLYLPEGRALVLPCVPRPLVGCGP
jgi:hypothetical protein